MIDAVEARKIPRLLRVAIMAITSIALVTLAAACSASGPPPTSTPEPTAAPPTPEPSPAPTATPEWTRAGWELLWHDEFEGDGIDREKWAFDIGGSGWGNQEWEFYTDRPENARIEAGNLVIEAREEFFIRRDYTSARLKTERLHEFQFGRVEARIQIPYGQGIWPAFWMLGTEGGIWPSTGEIDIMENIGREPRTVHGTVHGPGYSGGNGIGGSRSLPGADYADDFHVFAIEWEADQIRWYVDDSNYFTLRPEAVPGEWVFDDHPFYMLLNVAVGGQWPGYPDDSTTFPQRMLVDYVRVYQRADAQE